MSLSLLPKAIVESLTQLTPEYLSRQGIQLLMLDFDNTIVPYTTDIPTQQMLQWLEMMKNTDIALCVVSNSHKERVRTFCEKYAINCITHAKKPFSRGILECLRQYRLPASACALVGDQIYTDVLGANGCDVYSILVKSIDNHNFWLKARHILELPFIFAARKRKI